MGPPPSAPYWRQGLENVQRIKEILGKGENVVLMANHQTEADPQVQTGEWRGWLGCLGWLGWIMGNKRCEKSVVLKYRFYFMWIFFIFSSYLFQAQFMICQWHELGRVVPTHRMACLSHPGRGKKHPLVFMPFSNVSVYHGIIIPYKPLCI